MTVVVAAIDHVAEPFIAVNIDDRSVSLTDNSTVEPVDAITGGNRASFGVERVEEESSETPIWGVSAVVVVEVEYNVVSTVLLATTTLEEVAGVIVLNESGSAEVDEEGLVLDDCSELTVVGSMYSVPSVELITPVEIMVDELVEEEVVPSVTIGITTREVYVKVARVKLDDISDGEVG